MKVCSKCKNKVSNKTKICPKCGNDVSMAKIIVDNKKTNNKKITKPKPVEVKEEVVETRKVTNKKKQDQKKVKKENKSKINIKVVKKKKSKFKTFIDDLFKSKKKKKKKSVKKVKEVKEIKKETIVDEDFSDVNNKSSSLIWILIVVGVVIFFTICCIVVVNFSFGKYDDEISSKEYGKHYKIGDRVLYNDVIYSLNSVSLINGTEHSKPKDGNQFVLVSISMENIGDEKIKYSYSNWKMSNSKDVETSRIFTPVNASSALYNGTLYVESSKSGTMVFEEAIDEDLELRFYEKIEEENEEPLFKLIFVYDIGKVK